MKKHLFAVAVLAAAAASASAASFTYGDAIESAADHAVENAAANANTTHGSAVAAEHRVLRAGMRDGECNGMSLRQCLGNLVLSNCPTGQLWTTEQTGIAHCAYPPPPPPEAATPAAVYTPDPSPVVATTPVTPTAQAPIVVSASDAGSTPGGGNSAGAGSSTVVVTGPGGDGGDGGTVTIGPTSPLVAEIPTPTSAPAVATCSGSMACIESQGAVAIALSGATNYDALSQNDYNTLTNYFYSQMNGSSAAVGAAPVSTAEANAILTQAGASALYDSGSGSTGSGWMPAER